MLTLQETNMAFTLSQHFDVPFGFVAMVIESDRPTTPMTNQQRVTYYAQRIRFLDAILMASNDLNDDNQFHAESLATQLNVPIELARIVISAEQQHPIPEHLQTQVRAQRVQYFLILTSFLVNHEQLQELF